MSTADAKPKTLFLNGVEVETLRRTGSPEMDLAAVKRFLTRNEIHRPQQRLTRRAKVRSAWAGKYR